MNAIIDLKELLLKAPNSQIDDNAKSKVREWKLPLTALQILRVLDFCAEGSNASDFVMSMLNGHMFRLIKEENTTFDEICKQATWR